MDTRTLQPSDIIKIKIGPQSTVENAAPPKILPLVSEHDPVLHSVSSDVDLTHLMTYSKLIADMKATLVHHNGYGLSAVQVGVAKRIFVCQMQRVETFINPQLMGQSDKFVSQEEGCLSFPFLFVPKTRADTIKMQWCDELGILREHLFVGLTARVLLHELDHLNGITIVDTLTSIERMMANKRRIKLARRNKKK